MDSYFRERMFNPQFVNQDYFNQCLERYDEKNQDEMVLKAANKMRELCETVKGMDEIHQQQAFYACLITIINEFER